MDEKALYELKTDIANLKKLHEQFESLHRQQTEKSNQTKTNESLTEREIPGKIHECSSLYAQGIHNLREEFSKRAQSIGDKIAACFEAAYFKELEIDQRIIALESKTSPYTLIDQTVAVLGLVREAQRYSLLSEVTEGDYTDLLNLYRIALRSNNRTTLAFIEDRLEKLTREPGKNREDEGAKKALLNLVKRSAAKRLDPKVGELKELFDALINEHDCLIKDLDGDIKKPEVPPGAPFETSEGEQSPALELLEQQTGPSPEPAAEQQALSLAQSEEHTGPLLEQEGQQEIPPLEPLEAPADLPLEPLEQPSGLEMESPRENLSPTAETREDGEDHAEVRVESQDETMVDPGDLLLQAWVDTLDKRTGPPVEGPGQQEDPPLEPLEKHEDLPLEPPDQLSGLVMEALAEDLQPTAETMKDHKDAAESPTVSPDTTMVDPGDLLLQAWTEALDKRPGPPAEDPEQQADPSLGDMQAHANPSSEQAEKQEYPPLEHVGQQEGPPLEPLEQQTDLPLEPLEEHADLPLEPLDQPSVQMMETPAETLQTPAETMEDQKDAPESLQGSPDEKTEDPGKMLIRAWMETLEQQPDARLESPEEQPGSPLEQIEEDADIPLESLEEQPEIVMEPPVEAQQPSAETGDDQKDASETLMESPDENTEDLGKILVQEWMKNLEHKTEAPSEPPEKQTEITMKAPEEEPESTEETAKTRDDAPGSPMEPQDENAEDLGKILVQEWMKILDQKPAIPWTFLEEQAEQPSGSPGDELHPQEEKREATEQSTETLLEKPLETMDVSEALERIRSIERTKTLETLKPMDLTEALERITALEKSRPLEKIHARPAKTKTRKKTAPKKRKKSPTKKGKSKKAKK